MHTMAADSERVDGDSVYFAEHDRRTSMRRHILSSRRGGRSVWWERQLFCLSRYASIRTLGEPSLWWLGAYDAIRLFELRALQSSERSSLKGGPSSHSAVALC